MAEAEALQRRALHLVHGAGRIDDLAAHVGGDPDLVHLDLAGCVDIGF